MSERRVLAFYKFVPIADPELLREELDELGTRLDLKGTILVATEGFNGTLVGTAEHLQTLRDVLHQKYGETPFKWSDLNEDNLGFYRYKVKVKPEIVSFGVEDLDLALTGEHVCVERWNALLEDPNVVVIDTRNTYEIDIGTFPTAVSPETTNFREFPQWVQDNLDPQEHREVAMFCTGGIRCEKASAYMRQLGFDNVYQLDGGVLRYLENAAPEENLWQGECFVFDQRVSVNAELEQGQYQQCYACRHPLSAADLKAECYELGVSCPHCPAVDPDDEQAQRRTHSLRERQRQIALAESRGKSHIGTPQ